MLHLSNDQSICSPPAAPGNGQRIGVPMRKLLVVRCCFNEGKHGIKLFFVISSFAKITKIWQEQKWSARGFAKGHRCFLRKPATLMLQAMVLASDPPQLPRAFQESSSSRSVWKFWRGSALWILRKRGKWIRDQFQWHLGKAFFLSQRVWCGVFFWC